MFVLRAIALGFGMSLALPAMAQDETTLADIRQSLSIMHVEIQQLKRELNTTSGAAVPGAGSVLDRVNGIEAELRRLTGKAEELEFRMDQIVRDGTGRIEELNFRLCELEVGCDIANLPDPTPLGGGATTEPPAATIDTQPRQPQLAVGENADFRRAKDALEARDFHRAAELFAQFTETYPGGPLGPEAHLRRGEALQGLGDIREAARAYVDGYSMEPDGAVAPESLYRLGIALGLLDKLNESCLMFAEIGARFPDNGYVAQADAQRVKTGCQ